MKKKVKPKKENGERWLLTYADMITLLLALFILLYGMSNVDQEKYEKLAESLNASLGDGKGASIFDGTEGIMDNRGNTIFDNYKGTGGDGQSSVTTVPTTVTPKPTETASSGDDSDTLTTQEDMNDLKNGINEIVDDMNVEGAIGTAIAERGLTISLADDAFFDSGKADLKTKMKKGISQIAKLLNKIDNPIIIEGYTDNIPISSSIYSSNWQLSGARSGVVAEYLVEDEKVDGTRIASVGYGEYRPIASNDTAEGRSQNRRVDITILYDEAPGMEIDK